MSEKEQEAVCFRYIDKDLVPWEQCIGLYEFFFDKEKNTAKVIMDVLKLLNLPTTGLCDQAYVRAANIPGEYNGTQDIQREIKPLFIMLPTVLT